MSKKIILIISFLIILVVGGIFIWQYFKQEVKVSENVILSEEEWRITPIITPEMKARAGELGRYIWEIQNFLIEPQWGWGDIVIKEGIYVTADSIFNIRRLILDIPFRISFANTAGYENLRLRRIEIYGPDGALLELISHMAFLPSAEQNFNQMIAAQRVIKEKGKEFLKEVEAFLVKEEMSVKKKERLEILIREFEKTLWESKTLVFTAKGGIGEKMQHISTSVDLIPYLKKPGDEAIITARAVFNIKTVDFPFIFRLDSPLPAPGGEIEEVEPIPLLEPKPLQQIRIETLKTKLYHIIDILKQAEEIPEEGSTPAGFWGIIKEGIYIEGYRDEAIVIPPDRVIDDMFIFSVAVGNIAGYRNLVLEKTEVYEPDGTLLESISRMDPVPSIKQDFERMVAVQGIYKEESKKLLNRAKPLLVKLDKKGMSVEEIKKLEGIVKEIEEATYESIELFTVEVIEQIDKIRRKKIVRTDAMIDLDLTPYLKKVGDEAVMTVRAVFNIKAVDIPFTFRLGPSLPRP